MRVALLSAGQGWHNAELLRALEQRGHEALLLPITAMRAQVGRVPMLSCRDVDLTSLDALIVRIIPRGSLEQTIFRMDALHLLAAQGTRVINPAQAIERSVDKLYTSGLLALAGLPTPPTVVCERSADALAAFDALGGDVVVKPLFGSMGHGLVRVDDEELAYRVFKALEIERAVYYLQRTIAHPGCDIRAFIVGGRVIAAIERRAAGWRTNLARGGTAQAITLSPEQEELCLRAAAVVGAEVAGVDLLPANDGTLYLLEVNAVPGWQGLQATTSRDIAAEIVDYATRT